MSLDTPAQATPVETASTTPQASAPAHYGQIDELYRQFRQASSQANTIHVQGTNRSHETLLSTLDSLFADFGKQLVAQRQAIIADAQAEAQRILTEANTAASAHLEKIKREEAKLEVAKREAAEREAARQEAIQLEAVASARAIAEAAAAEPTAAEIRPHLSETDRASQIALQPVESDQVSPPQDPVEPPSTAQKAQVPAAPSAELPPLPSILAQHLETAIATPTQENVVEQAPPSQPTQPVQPVLVQQAPAVVMPEESARPTEPQQPIESVTAGVAAVLAPGQPAEVAKVSVPAEAAQPSSEPVIVAQTAQPPSAPVALVEPTQVTEPAPPPAVHATPPTDPPATEPVSPERVVLSQAAQPEPAVTPFVAMETTPPPAPVDPAVIDASALPLGEEALPQDVVLRTVAQRTGYPVEMLTDYLTSGTDLEITQSKLIEIFTTVGDQFPRAPKLDVPQIPNLTSLSSLVAFLTKSPVIVPAKAPPQTAISNITPETTAEIPVLKAAIAAEPEAIAEPASPFQLAPEVARAEQVAESPFQVAPEDDLEIAPPAELASPFQVAPDLAAESDPTVTVKEPRDSEPLTPFHAVAEAETQNHQSDAAIAASPFEAAEPISSPFKPAEAAAPAEPAQAAPEAPSPAIAANTPIVAAPAAASAPREAVVATVVPPEPDPDLPTVAIDRFVNRGRVALPCGLSLAQLHRVGLIHIVPDDRRVAEALRDLLITEGLQAEIVQEVPATSTAAIVLSGLKQASTTEHALAIQLEAFQAAKALSNNIANKPGLFVTVQDTGGDFGMTSSEQDRAWVGGLTGLTRSVAAEWPSVGVKALDLEREGRSAEVLARRIVRELTEGGPEVEIGLSADGTRLTRAMERKDVESGTILLPDDSVVVVLGAGEPILTEPIKALGRKKRLRFVLLGNATYQDNAEDPFKVLTNPDDLRKALREMNEQAGESVTPEFIENQTQLLLAQREIRNTLQALAESNCTACYFSVDATEASALETVINQVRAEWGPIAGLIHNTGVVREGRIETKTAADFRAILHANITGFENFLALTKEDPLQLMCFLSPSLQHSSSAGHADYSTANEILNKTACAESRRRGSQCLVRAINWSYWDDGTLPDQVKSVLNDRGIALVPRHQTGAILVNELSGSPHAEVEVTISPKQAVQAAQVLSNFNNQMEINVSSQSIPNLIDHRIQGAPAVPAVMVMEWFMRNANQIVGQRGPLRCREFKQLQGIALPNFNEGGAPFNIVTENLASLHAGGSSPMSLQDMDGQLRYSGIIEQVTDESALGLVPAPELELERTSWTGSHVYGPGALFHGPSFQVIHRVEGVSPEGALGRLLPPEDAGWSDETLLFHPAMIDGATQLAFVWGLFTQDNEFLATSIGEFVQAPNANYNQALRCILEGIETLPEKLTFNIYLESDAAEPVAVLRNVECQPAPSGAVSRG